VLLADDNPPMLLMLEVELSRLFAVAGAVPDGRRLVAAALAATPDVIVSDLSMPGLDGLEAMRMLRELGHRVPFVIVSADPDAEAECLSSGAAAFVPKQDIATALVPTIIRVLAGSPLPSRRQS
jgi:CheY-like chemotaxis protein